MKAPTITPLYDVVIYNIDTRIVGSIAGFRMYHSHGTHNAQQRVETVKPRLNERHDCAIVPAMSAKVGDKLPEPSS